MTKDNQTNHKNNDKGLSSLFIQYKSIKEQYSDIKIGDVLGYADIYLNKYPVAKVKVISGQRVKKQPFYFIKKLLFKGVTKNIGSKSVIDFEPDVFYI